MKKTMFRCGNLRILLMLCLLASVEMSFANVIRGRVVDDETGEPLEGAQVSVNEAFGTTTFWTKMETDSLGYFHYRCGEMGRVTFTAQYFGYYEGTAKTIGMEGNDTVRIKDIRLKPSPLLLKEVEVSAKKRRFFMRGDTVVFNPEAFNLEEGARLEELIEKLPGVSIKDGRLLWNNEPLKLMMNGREVFSEGMLLKHLPAEAVENIKAYDQKSELAERTGVKDGKEEHVLDVSIKPSWMDKFYGGLMGAGYSSGHYAAELNAMRLSDNNPLMLFGRVANEPAEIKYKTMNSISSSSGGEPVEQQMASVGYQHSWDSGQAFRHNYWNLTTNPNHTDRSKESWEHTQTFLPGTTPTESHTTSHEYQHDMNVPLHSVLNLYIGQKYALRLEGKVAYEEGRKESERELEQTNLVHSTYHTSHRTKGITGNGEASLTRFIENGAASTSISLDFRSMNNKGASEGNYHYYAPTPRNTLDLQSFDTDIRHLSARWHVGLSKGLGEHVFIGSNFRTTYRHDTQDEQRQRDDMPDLANSLYSHSRTWENTLSTGATLTYGTLTLRPSIGFSHQHEHLDYQRAALDTTARRDLLLVSPSFDLKYKIKKQMTLKGSLGYSIHPANLQDCIDYVDDTNPLYVRSGNSQLKNSHTLRAGIGYNLLLTRANQALSFSADYQKQYDPIAPVLHYESQTGVYHATQKNVEGGNRWDIGLDYERSIGEHLTWRNKLSEGFGKSYGILTLVDEETEVTYNRQKESLFSYSLGAEYGIKDWTLDFTNEFQWTNFTYSDASQQGQDIFHNETVLNIRYRLSHWTFHLRPKLVIDRGHIASEMNTNQFLLNASVTYKFLHNKAELTLEGKDLFNQVRRNTYHITPTTHTESGTHYLHHYVALTFKYKFDAKDQKR